MLGRNDPCHCGSGKKYKKCCWTKDKAVQNIVEDAWIDDEEAWDDPDNEIDSEFPIHFPEKDESSATPSVVEPDPLFERMNAFWEAFEDASYEEQWVLVEDLLTNEPEIIDAEIVFEITNSMFSQAIAADESDRFSKLLDQFEVIAPEAYQAELGYILDWRINIALQQGNKADVAAYFFAFSPIAGDKLDEYYRVMSMLAYHGELDILYQGMREVVPFVKEGGGLVEWAYDDFIDKLAGIEILYLLSQNRELTSEDPTLKQHFAEYDLTLHPEGLNLTLNYRKGQLTPTWTLTDFDFEPNNDDDDPARKNLTYLLMAFTHFAQTEGVSLTKAEMARNELYQYLVMRSEGELSDSGGDYGRRPQKRRRRKKRKTELHPLCPDAKTFDAYLSRLVGFMAMQHYEACALFELMPTWLQFLCKYNLLNEEIGTQTLKNLDYLKEPLISIAQINTSDAHILWGLAGWPYDATTDQGE